jgi:hypothetical protein
MVEEVDCLSSKCKALSLNLYHKKEKGKGREDKAI